MINNRKNVEAHNLAVSDSSGMLSYKREENHSSPIFRLSTDATNGNSSNFISVNAVTMDVFFQNKYIKPDVIKNDIKGAEMNVLSGMIRLLEKFNPKLFLEIHPANLPLYKSSVSAILMLLMNNKYKIFEINGMRCQDSSKKLKELSPESAIENNSMIYAVSLR